MSTQTDSAAPRGETSPREKEQPLRVAVLGAGALGSLYGGLLALAGCEVTLISTRLAHVAAINTRGLAIETQGQELLVTNLAAVNTPREALAQGAKPPHLSGQPADLLLVCVKSVATANAIAEAACLVGRNTAVLTLQNGLGNVEALCTAIPRAAVMAGVAYSGSTFQEPGRIREAGRGKTIIGELDGSGSPRAAHLCAYFNAAGLPTSVSSNVEGLLWTKLMANVGINALAALTGLKNGALLEQPGIIGIMDAAVAEAMAVAKAKGIRLEVDAPQDYCRGVASNTADNYCSMVQDVQNKRRTEVESINGAIVAYGKELGVPTPVNAMLTELVLARQRGYL